MAINTTSYLNTPQATNDLFTSATTGLTEDWLFVTYLAVMSNDLGGGAKTLYSIDNGTNSSDASSPTDLLAQDIVRTEALTTDRSANGAKIWITTDGKVGYDAATLSADFKDQLQQLTAGQFLTDTFTYAIRLGNGTLSWATATVQIAGANDAPVVTGAVTGNAEEDAPSVTLDALANASDVDAGATLSVLDIPASLPPGVSYDASTHSFTLDPSHPDFQHLAAGEHATVTVNYRVTDGTSTTAASVSWNVVGTNDAPEVTGAVTGSATEDAPSVTLNALAHATDVDTGATLSVTNLPASLPPGVTWDAATQSFTLDPSDSAFQHLAAGEPMTVTVNYGVTDGTATTAASVAWNVVGTNDVPVITSNGGGATASLSVNENSSLVTTVTATDPDDGATQTYSIVGGTDAARFTIDASTGALSFVSAPNSEAPDDSNSDNVYDVTVRVSDGVSFDEQAIAVAVSDVNEFSVTTPTDTNAASNAVNENVAIGTVVGVTAFASDADATTSAVTYSLTSNPGGLFAIDATTGVVTTAVAIDRETLGASVTIEVTATSADTSTAAQSFSIAINDVNEFAVTTPTDTNVTANAVDENAAAGTVVGVTAFASDADATTNTVSYSLADNAGGKFAIDSSTGVVTVAGAIDREVDASLNITVRATSADGSTADQSFTLAVNDVDEFDVSTPVDSNAAADAVNENVAIGTVVGVTAFASDADATTSAVTYSLTSNPGGLFAIDATTGVVTTAVAIDRETLGASVTIEVTATSADTSTAAQSFSIAINDVNEFSVTTPTDTNAAANAVNENVAIGTLVGITASASDADATTSGVTYSLSSNPGDLFAINAATGVVTTAAAINREAVGPSVTIGVTATSADGSTSVQSFGIAINDLNEFAVTTPVDANAAANAVTENVAIGTLVGITASASDADATTNGVTYSLSSNPGGLFSINAATGAVTTAAAIDREALGASVSIGVAATSADGSSAVQTFSIAINGVNEAPVSGADTVITNVGTGTPFVIPEWALLANDADPEGSTLDVDGIGSPSGATAVHTAGSGTSGFVTFSDTAPAGGSFTYAATDGTNVGSSTLVTIVQDAAAPLNGAAGNEILVGRTVADTLVGNAGNDILLGGAGNDVYQFGLADGTDTIFDSASTGTGDAINISGSPITSLNFERVGNDLIINANDTQIAISGHYAGNAVEQVAFTTAGGTAYGYSLGTVAYTLATSTTGGSSADVVAGTSSSDALDGGTGSGRDLLFGSASNDTLTGGNGDDLLVGGSGNDTMDGGGANDFLVGGDGNDTLTGGGNNTSDTFVFNTALNGSTNVDTITDFEADAHDRIALDVDIFSVLSVGGLSSSQFAANAGGIAGDANDYVLYDTNTGNLFYDADGNGSGLAVKFATLTLGGLTPTVDSSDFTVTP